MPCSRMRRLAEAARGYRFVATNEYGLPGVDINAPLARKSQLGITCDEGSRHFRAIRVFNSSIVSGYRFISLASGFSIAVTCRPAFLSDPT